MKSTFALNILGEAKKWIAYKVHGPFSKKETAVTIRERARIKQSVAILDKDMNPLVRTALEHIQIKERL